VTTTAATWGVVLLLAFISGLTTLVGVAVGLRLGRSGSAVSAPRAHPLRWVPSEESRRRCLTLSVRLRQQMWYLVTMLVIFVRGGLVERDAGSRRS